MSNPMEGKMNQKVMDPELAAIIANHKPRGLKFSPSNPPKLKTLEEEFGPEKAARMRREAKLAHLGDPKEKPES